MASPPNYTLHSPERQILSAKALKSMGPFILMLLSDFTKDVAPSKQIQGSRTDMKALMRAVTKTLWSPDPARVRVQRGQRLIGLATLYIQKLHQRVAKAHWV